MSRENKGLGCHQWEDHPDCPWEEAHVLKFVGYKVTPRIYMDQASYMDPHLQPPEEQLHVLWLN